MAVFSTRQVRHFYLAKEVRDKLSDLANPGDIFVNSTDKEFWFNQMNALGSVVASDVIHFRGVESITATSSDDIAHKIHGYKICLDGDVNDGKPVPGQDYLITANISEFKGMSAENVGQKYGAARARSSWSASDLYKALAFNFAQNNACEPWPFLKVTLLVGGAEVEVTGKESRGEIEGDAEAIFIWEREQKWVPGLMSQQSVQFNVTLKPIYLDGFHQHWGTVEGVVSDETLPEGQLICDLEWFAMGERGDQYRGMGYPNVIPTRYLAEPDKLYDVVNIHYNYRDGGENPQASEKAIQIACLNDGSHTVANAVVEAINGITGLEVATL